jgi:hypothetical protein
MKSLGQSLRLASSLRGDREPFPRVPTRAICPCQGLPGAIPEAKCARRDSNPQHLASRASLSAMLEYEQTEPPPGADPGRPPYEGGAQPCAAAKLPDKDSNLD